MKEPWNQLREAALEICFCRKKQKTRKIALTCQIVSRGPAAESTESTTESYEACSKVFETPSARMIIAGGRAELSSYA